MTMSTKPLTEEELRQWVLSLPPESIRSLEDTLKSIRDCHFKSVVEQNVNNSEEDSVIKDKSEIMDDIDVSPPSRTTSPTSSNMSLHSRSKSGKTYENGRRNLKEEDVSLEEANRRAKRRERNRLAAAKCRKRRQDKIDTLQCRVEQLKNQMDEINTNIDQYKCEHDRLNGILASHKCTLNQPHSTSSATRPKDLKINRSLEQHQPISAASSSSTLAAISSSSNQNVFICSLSPQLINLSPLLTPSTMKLLIDSINSQQSVESTVTPIIKDELLQHSSVDSTFFTTISTPSNSFSQSLGLLNLMSPNTELLNMNILSSQSMKIATSLASTISTSNADSNYYKQNNQA